MKKLGLLAASVKSIISWSIIAALLGYAVFYFAIAKPYIGVIKISETIGLQQTEDIARMLKYAEGDSRIKAVVLEIDCPGGTSSLAEETFLNVLELREKKPVVAAVSRYAVSGGYHIAVAANRIVAKPSSFVGNIGVLLHLPEIEPPREDILSSGPFKLEGMSPRKAALKLEMVKESFLRAVMSQRGDRLKMTKEELARGELYIGIEALRYGLIDKIGSTWEASREAAELSGVKDYRLVDINEKLGIRPVLYWMPFSEAEGLAYGLPEFHYLYSEPER